MDKFQQGRNFTGFPRPAMPVLTRNPNPTPTPVASTPSHGRALRVLLSAGVPTLAMGLVGFPYRGTGTGWPG